jgi:hypothetical protein
MKMNTPPPAKSKSCFSPQGNHSVEKQPLHRHKIVKVNLDYLAQIDKLNDRLLSKAGPEVAMLHALVRGLCE